MKSHLVTAGNPIALVIGKVLTVIFEQIVRHLLPHQLVGLLDNLCARPS